MVPILFPHPDERRCHRCGDIHDIETGPTPNFGLRECLPCALATITVKPCTICRAETIFWDPNFPFYPPSNLYADKCPNLPCFPIAGTNRPIGYDPLTKPPVYYGHNASVLTAARCPDCLATGNRASNR